MDRVAIIRRYIVSEFLPDIGADELAPDYDLLAGGVIDSLALLKVVDWLETRFKLPMEHLDISPDNFRTVNAMSAFVESVELPARS